MIESTSLLFKYEQRIFKFRQNIPNIANKNVNYANCYNVRKGQYEFPFTFLIPENHPSSFVFIDNNGAKHQVKYFMHVYFSKGNGGELGGKAIKPVL